MAETKSNGEIVNKDPASSLLIITDQVLLYLRIDNKTGNKPERLFKAKLKKMTACSVYQNEPTLKSGTVTYIMMVSCYYLASGMSKYQFVGKDYAKFEKCYKLLSILPQVEAEDRVRNTKNKATKLLEQIL